MNSRIRVKSRILILNKTLFLVAVFLIGVFLIISVNLLPYILKNTVLIILENQSYILKNSVNLALSFFVLLIGVCSFCALNLGADRYFLNLAQEKEANIKDVFHYFLPKYILKATWFNLKLFLMKSVVFLFFQLPTIFLVGIIAVMINDSISAAVLLVLTISIAVVFVSGLVFYSLVNSRLFLIKYYYINGDQKGFLSAITSSQESMKKSKSNLISLTASFSAWFLSCVFIIPIFYVWSYFRQSKAVMANLIIGQ